MRWRIFCCVAFVCFLATNQASAWLLQPPFNVPEVQAEIDTFQEASANMLDAFANLNSTLATAERNHAPVSSDTLISLRASILDAITLYEAAATDGLAQLPLSIEALAEVSRLLAANLQREDIPEVTDARALARALIVIARRIDETLSVFIENGGITPDDPLNISAREGISILASEMNLFLQVGNAGAVGIGISSLK